MKKISNLVIYLGIVWTFILLIISTVDLQSDFLVHLGSFIVGIFMAIALESIMSKNK